MQRPVAAALALAALLLVGSGCARAEDPGKLWQIVHDGCVPNQQLHADPAPCVLVNLRDGAERGYAVLKDARGKTQFLLVPTAPVIGIESPALLQPGAPDYFAAAWRERGFVERAVGRELPLSAIGLAINSTRARSQNQLHIHIDCMRSDVLAALQRLFPGIADRWAPLAEPLAGARYRAMRVSGKDLDGVDPFRLLADGVPDAKAAMGSQSLVIVGVEFAEGQPGFAILNGQIDLAHGDIGRGESLQDHSCALAQQ